MHRSFALAVVTLGVVEWVAGLAASPALAQAKAPAKPPKAEAPAEKPAEAPQAGGPAKTPVQQLITMDFQDVEIGVLVKFISEITGKNFILDEKVRGKVTVISPTKITIDEAYRVFQSILEVKGFTTAPAGPVTKIVPVREAKESGAPISGAATGGDEFTTQLLPLSFVDASSLVPVLQPMVSKDGLITAYDATNTLILIDSASNIERLLRIISELDIEVPGRGIELIHLENAYAESVAATLQEVLEAQPEKTPKGAPPAVRPGGPAVAPSSAAGTPPFRVISDERTNSIIVLASPGQIRTVRSLVKELDKKLEGVSKINVYPLKYANAEEMVQVISQLIGGAGMGGGLGLPTGPSRRSTRQQQQQRQAGGLQQRSARNRLGGAGGLGQLAQAFGQAGGGPAGAAGAAGGGATSAVGGGGEFIGEVRVTADPYTNSLIVSAGPQDYDVLRRVISELDVPRRQVFVEAIILEVSLDKSRELGLETQGGISLQNGIGIGRLNLQNMNSFLSSPASISGLVMAAASQQTVSVPDGKGGRIEVPAQVALFTALQSDSDVNILSAPTILTSDNQEAEILVGQNIPFIASRATDTTNLANTFATVERQDVGISLRLTPQISQGDIVRLDVYEEVSAVVPNPPVDPNIAGPTTTVRSASTTVVARSGQTVVLGGLISDNTSNAQSKIPYVSDIPVLGNLFKFTSDKKNKINLLIFLTPHVVHDETDLRQLSSQERDKFKRELLQQRTGPRRREQLDRPSWEAAPVPTPVGGPPPILTPQTYAAVPAPTAAVPLYAAPQPVATPPPPPPPKYAAPARAPVFPSSPAALGIPASGHRFAVLLSLFEKGTPPPELETSNGFLTVYVPEDTPEFFTKGGSYEYGSPRYEAKYTCLEVFPTATEALAVYPEGQPLERWGGTVVRWKPMSAEQMRQVTTGLSPWKRTR